MLLVTAIPSSNFLLKPVDAFLIHHQSYDGVRHTTATMIGKNNDVLYLLSPLFMGKGFNKARGKQAELAKKIELAKLQKETVIGAENDEESERIINDINTTNTNKDDVVMKQRHDEFEMLLRTTKGAMPSYDKSDDSAYINQVRINTGESITQKKKKAKLASKTKKINKAEKEAKQKKEIEMKQKAQRIHFESLIDVVVDGLSTATENIPLGAIGAAKLVPWVPPYLKSCLIVFVDPRKNSQDLRRSIQYGKFTTTE